MKGHEAKKKRKQMRELVSATVVSVLKMLTGGDLAKNPSAAI